MNVQDSLELLIVAGHMAIIGFSYWGVLVVSQICVWLWKIIDDLNEMPDNPLMEFIMINMLHYKLNPNYRPGYFKYGKKNSNEYGTDSAPAVLKPLIILMCIPPVLFIFEHFLIQTFMVIGLVGLVFLLRTGRRLQKLIKNHIDNFKIHNQEK